MDFIKPTFLFLFLPLLAIFYGLAERRFRPAVLLAASLIFVAWSQPIALAWLGGLLLMAHMLGCLISLQRRLALLWLGIGASLLILCFFKYTTYFSLASLGVPTTLARTADDLLMPLGISYVTFQVISYLVDVWKGQTPAERNLVHLGLYIFFFPKLVSGPLVRYRPFADQLTNLNPDQESLAAGIRRLLAGFAKRALIANTLGITVDAAFGMATPNYSTNTAWLVFFAYALQIYFDFSGYTDMALGLAQMAGIRLPENFNHPYLAESVGDFWRRWHISLSTWFREYVFFPLERRRLPVIGQPLNILIVFALTGLWHGFKPTFLIWGLIHGLALALESLFLARWLKKLWRPLRTIYALLIVLPAWVFFRAEYIDFAPAFFQRLAGAGPAVFPQAFADTRPLPFIEPTFLLALAIGLLLCLPIERGWQMVRAQLETRAPAWFFFLQPLEDIFLFSMFVLGVIFVLGGNFAPNIYANF